MFIAIHTACKKQTSLRSQWSCIFVNFFSWEFVAYQPLKFCQISCANKQQLSWWNKKIGALFNAWKVFKPTVEPVVVVAIEKPERQARKASHCGSKQQQMSHAVLTLLLLFAPSSIWVLFFTLILFVVNRTFNATPTDRLQHYCNFCSMWKSHLPMFSIELSFREMFFLSNLQPTR